MKNKFLILILSLILLSACTLSTGMYAVNEKSEEPKDYEFSEQSFDFTTKKPDEPIDTPTPQEELKEKFQSMYEIDEETNSITVISKDFYESYWADKNKEGKIVSLTLDEVLFVIQDSINIYCKYDEIVLNNFDVSSNSEMYTVIPITGDNVGDRYFPVIEREGGMEEFMLDDISCIINYRISSLSSPEAFISAKEFCEYSGKHTNDQSKMYFPGLENVEERMKILAEYDLLRYYSSIHWMDYREAVVFKHNGWRYDYYVSVEDSKNSTDVFYNFLLEKVFSTDEINETLLLFWNETNLEKYAADYVDNDEFGVWFTLNKGNHTFTMGAASAVSHAISGKFEKEEDKLILRFETQSESGEDVKYVFNLIGDKYVYSEKDSAPFDGQYNIKDGTEFVAFS